MSAQTFKKVAAFALAFAAAGLVLLALFNRKRSIRPGR